MLKRCTTPACFLTAFLLTCFAMLLSSPAQSAEELSSPTKKAQELQNFYSSLTSIAFNFTQVTRTGNRERYGKGIAVFVKPQNFNPGERPDTGGSETKSVMRWNYTEPDKQVIINDGDTLLIYTEKDKQLIKTSSRELETDITYAFFSGTGNLLDDFEARAADSNFIFSSTVDLQVIQLVPRKPHNRIKSIQIWFDNQHVIHHLVIEDHFDSKTELNFEDISLNSIQADDREKIVSFTVPPGTEIITQ